MTLNAYLLSQGITGLSSKTESDLGVKIGDEFRRQFPNQAIPRIQAHIQHRKINDYPEDFLKSCEDLILEHLLSCQTN